MQKAGHNVRLANDGREALKEVTENYFDVVLMDMHMPEMDGLEATRAIRRLSGPQSQVPIIALTAAGSLSDIQICLDARMNNFLVKPFRGERLRAVLLELFSVRERVND